MQYVGPNGPLKLGLRNICFKRILILFFINISGELVIHYHLLKFCFNLLKNYTEVQFYRKIKKN